MTATLDQNFTIQVKRALMMIFNEIALEFNATRRRPWSEAHHVIEGGALIVDLGCGSGRHSVLAAKHGCEVIAVDLARGMVELVNMKAHELGLKHLIHPLICDMNYLPFRGDSINHALCLATIHHIPLKMNRVKALREVYRVLKANGKLVVSVWAKFQPRFFRKIPSMIWSYLTGKVSEFGDIYVPWKSRKGVFMRFYHLYSRREILGELSNANFRIVKVYGKSFKSKFFAENHVVVAVKV